MLRASQSLFALTLVLAFPQPLGDLGAALRRRGYGGGATPVPAVVPPSGPLVVQLERVEARALTGRHRHTRDSFYVGNISIGHPPQRLQVLFDTGSGHVLLPHRGCESPACLEHRRYSPWESSTAMDVNEEGGAVQTGTRLAQGPVNRTVVTVEFAQADLGSGAAKGVLVRDNVCLGSAAGGAQACASLAVLAATRLDDEPFRAMPHDGILGLALEGLGAGALSSFYERLMDGSQDLLPHFGLLMDSTRGEIIFGGHDHARLAAPLQWFPVASPEEGFWQVKIHSVRVGSVTVDECSAGCRGIIDTGSSSLGAQKDGLQKLLPRLKTASAVSGKCRGPDLHLDLRGFVLVMTAEDYTGTACEPELGLLDLDPKKFLNVYALGTSALHRSYTAFDWAGARLGFAPLAATPRLSSVTRSKLVKEPAQMVVV